MSKGKTKLTKKIQSTWADPQYTIARDDPENVGRTYTTKKDNVIHTAGQTLDPHALNHELGHLYDRQNLTDWDRQQLGQIFGKGRPWKWANDQEAKNAAAGTVPNEEAFAQAYSWLKLHKEQITRPTDKSDKAFLDYGGRVIAPSKSKLELIRSMLINHDRFVRDATGKPIGFKPEYLKK